MNQVREGLVTAILTGLIIANAIGVVPVSTVLLGALWISLLVKKNGNTIRFLILSGKFLLISVVIRSILSPSIDNSFFFIFSIFHLIENFIITKFSKNEIFDSLLLNHSVEYSAAFTLTIIERNFIRWSDSGLMVAVGVTGSVVGLVTRHWAMWEAGESFTHIIATRKRDNHRLVTTGPYAWMRHPSYFGWFVFSMFSQLILNNLINFLIFSIINFIFFRDRIPYEEGILVEFYGPDYVAYMDRVRFSGVPFVNSR
jgi:protein-S-isoprenylcysteine O-methyltransferase